MVDGQLYVENPATGEILDELSIARDADVDKRVSLAGEAQSAWRGDLRLRRERLRRCAKVLSRRSNMTMLATLLTREQGKPFRESLREVVAAATWFSSAAELDLTPETIPHESSGIQVHLRPLGVVGAITPWNYPLLLASAKVAPALLVGNAVIVKPSPFTPLATRAMCELLTSDTKVGSNSVLPPGVLQVLIGDDETGRQLVQHSAIAKISFTGSTDAGRRIAALTGEHLKRVTLELGGNDAAIVLEDVDINAIIKPLFWAAFTNAGQFCVGMKRLYVARTIHEELVSRLVDMVAEVKLGAGTEPGVQMGPVATPTQHGRIIELVEDAKQCGGVVRCGGDSLDGPGYFFPPTIVTNVGPGVRLVDEEQFGPVLPIMPFDDREAAITLANSTAYGLGGSIWTRDLERGSQLAAQMECGTCWVNHHGQILPQAPFGGWKSSGMGYENGRMGLYDVSRLQVINQLST